MVVERYYCTGCKNAPDEPCCHLRADKPRVPMLECRCTEYGIPAKKAPS